LDKLFDLMLQPVVDANNELLYVECFVRFKQLQSKLPPLLFEFNESGAMLSLESTKQFTRQSKAVNIDGLQGNGLYYVRNFNTLLRESADTIKTELKLNDF
jgi:hypothetical protein